MGSFELFLLARLRERHAGATQRLVLDEDHSPPKRERTLRDQQRLQMFERSREIGYFEETFGLLRPAGNCQIPAACQMLADAANGCVEDGVADQLRLRIEHDLPPLGLAVEIVKKSRHCDVQSVLISLQAVGDLGQGIRAV